MVASRIAYPQTVETVLVMHRLGACIRRKVDRMGLRALEVVQVTPRRAQMSAGETVGQIVAGECQVRIRLQQSVAAMQSLLGTG